MADDKKILSLDNVKIFRNYIEQSLGEAYTSLDSEYNKKLHELTSEIDNIKNSGLTEHLEQLRLELDALNANFEDKKDALDLLKTDFENLYNGITDGSVFSEGQLNEIIKTALVDKTVITDEMVSTPSVFTQQIVSLIGNFGKLNASQIEAGTLKGSNIESTTKISGTNDPVWSINNNGAGYLANKNISWDQDGNVNFGPNVKLSWNDNITDTPNMDDYATKEDLNGIENGLSKEDVNNLITTEISKYEVKAENITGSTISGKTIQSGEGGSLSGGPTTDENGNPVYQGPYWKLNNDGSGYLAQNNIKWTDKGIVTFSDKVKLTWGNNIDGAPDMANYATKDDLNGIENGLNEEAVNNLITTEISKYEVKAENIKGNTISGKTIQSGEGGSLGGGPTTDENGNPVYQGPYWKLNNDGSGYLAQNNIKWTADGTVTFGNNVKLKWGNNIEDAPDMTKYATKEDLNSIESGGITDEVFTQLGNTWIETTTVEAKNLKIRKIETKSEAKDSIEIKDNYIHCLNDNGNKNLVISSNDIDTDMVDALANSNVFGEEDLWSFSNLKHAVFSPTEQRALNIETDPASILPLLELDKTGNREFTKLYNIPVTPKFENITYTKSNYINDEKFNSDVNNYNIPGDESMLLDTATFGESVAASVDKTANSIGYLFKGATIKIYPKLSTISNFKESYQSGNNRFLSLGTTYPDNWNFLGDYICTLYKKNSDGIWEIISFTRLPQAEKSIIDVTTGKINFENRNWSNLISVINNKVLTSFYNLYYNGVIEFNITESGEYGIAISLTNAEYYYSDGISETKNVLPYFFVSNDVINLVPLSDNGESSDPANVPSLLGVGDGFDEGPVNITRPSLQPDDHIGEGGGSNGGSSSSGNSSGSSSSGNSGGSSSSGTTFEPTILPGGIDGLNASYDLEIINNTIPDGYTEIGKNGLVTYNGQNLLACYDKGIEMKTRIKSGQNILTNNFYGFKVTPDGLYYCNGGTEYKKWTPS